MNPFVNLPKKKEPTETPAQTTGTALAPRTETNELIRQVEQYKKDLTPEQREKLGYFMLMQEMGIGAVSSPLICSDVCPFSHICPLFSENIHPTGKPCPVEYSIMQQYRAKLAASIGISLNSVDIDAYDLKILDDLAVLQMIKRRALAEMAKNPIIASKEPVLIMGGDQIEREITNPRLKVIQDIVRLETKLMDELVGTRKSRFNAGMRVGDPSKRAAELLSKIRQANQQSSDDIIDVEPN